jgi:hypothetical protein
MLPNTNYFLEPTGDVGLFDDLEECLFGVSDSLGCWLIETRDDKGLVFYFHRLDIMGDVWREILVLDFIKRRDEMKVF